MTKEEAYHYIDNLKWLKGYDNTVIGGKTVGEILDEINALLKEQEAQGWVSVKDKLPDAAGYKCLVAAINKFGQKSVFTAFTGYGDFEWYTTDVIYMNKANRNTVSEVWTITHWMPLPSTEGLNDMQSELPKEDDA